MRQFRQSDLDFRLFQKVDYGWGPNTVFRFPKYGGTGAVWRAMTEKLPNHWFHFGCELSFFFFYIRTLLFN